MMKTHLKFLLLFALTNWMFATNGFAQANDCQNLNQPARIGDSMHLSPFFCGSTLLKYCGTNQGMTNDSFSGVSYPQAGFFRFSACEDSVSFKLSVFDCIPSAGALNFSIYPGNMLSNNLLDIDTVQDLATGLLTFTGASPDTFYTIMVSGVDNSVCSFSVEAIAGIGTASSVPDSCVCTEESVTGPDFICPGELYTYTVTLPSCTVFPTDPIGGNGLFCVPDGACPPKPDSLVYKWHIPPGTSFIGDSTGLTISIQLDPAYGAMDTIRNDSIWLEWHYVYSDSSVLDSLNFCACYGAG
ncbi:MAG: hypothetical protein JNJ57_13635, partial [Saprospiraceae bacterium]|nr:hypothetical protein [Saprospiraceae bacterium]